MISMIKDMGIILFFLTSQASELKNKIPDICEAEYLFYLDRYAEIQYHIARIIKED